MIKEQDRCWEGDFLLFFIGLFTGWSIVAVNLYLGISSCAVVGNSKMVVICFLFMVLLVVCYTSRLNKRASNLRARGRVLRDGGEVRSTEGGLT